MLLVKEEKRLQEFRQQQQKTYQETLAQARREQESRQQVFEEQLRQRRLLRLEALLILGSIAVVASVFFIGLGLGLIAGANIPEGAVCHHSNFLCQGMRFRQPKSFF
uniref:Uncharacterized protein n=1 Tax=Cyanothece sp. (strain PCC 7425 / ATCC 29141) TaxID=395961 RepID=B8HYZ7_CYAP4